MDVSKVVWRLHEQDLRAAEDLFYTWQYDIRWAAQKLRDEGEVERVDDRRGVAWRLVRGR